MLVKVILTKLVTGLKLIDQRKLLSNMPETGLWFCNEERKNNRAGD